MILLLVSKHQAKFYLPASLLLFSEYHLLHFEASVLIQIDLIPSYLQHTLQHF